MSRRTQQIFISNRLKQGRLRPVLANKFEIRSKIYGKKWKKEKR